MDELVQRVVTAEDALTHIEIRARQSGVVHELNVHTVGGVIGPAETVMGIVEDEKVIEARVAPTDIDQVTSDKRQCCASRPSTSVLLLWSLAERYQWWHRMLRKNRSPA